MYGAQAACAGCRYRQCGVRVAEILNKKKVEYLFYLSHTLTIHIDRKSVV